MNKSVLIWALGLCLIFGSCTKEEEKDTLNIVNDNIDAATTFTSDRIWIIEGDVYVNADLTIEPGTVVQFKEDASLHIGDGVYGSLKSVGTEEKPITFTSASSNPQAGDWNGIFFYSKNSVSRSELSYCIIEYGGEPSAYDDDSGILELIDTDLKITHCIFRNIINCGICLSEYSDFVAFNNNHIEKCAKHLMVVPSTAAGSIGLANTFSTNSNYGILVTNSVVSTNVVWKKQDVPFYANAYIYVQGINGSLTIEAGTTIKMYPNGGFFIGNDKGQLIASGTAINPITFTSAAIEPSVGDWTHIYFDEYTTEGSVLNYCIIEYSAGISVDNEDAAIEINTSNVDVTNCKIRYNEGYGISVYSDRQPRISNNTFLGNTNDNVIFN